MEEVTIDNGGVRAVATTESQFTRPTVPGISAPTATTITTYNMIAQSNGTTTEVRSTTTREREDHT